LQADYFSENFNKLSYIEKRSVVKNYVSMHISHSNMELCISCNSPSNYARCGFCYWQIAIARK